MRILIIDGQGGRIGRLICESIKKEYAAQDASVEITAVGTNGAATEAMLRGGADHAATGENAVIVACRRAGIIVGPVGIVLADSLYGEVTPAMAAAVARSEATRVLIPVNKCDTMIAGVGDAPLSQLIDDALYKIREIIKA